MKTMKIVVEVSEETRNYCIRRSSVNYRFTDSLTMQHKQENALALAIANGTILPDDAPLDDTGLIHYVKGLEKGNTLGMRLGRFYDSYGITDTIPSEYADEVNKIIDETIKGE